MREGPPLGERVIHKPETGSTNDDVRALAAEGAPEGTVVRADRQVTGRGRGERQWASPDGGLWFSVLLRPGTPPMRWGLLPLAGGLAVAEALRARGIDAGVKWPNDVLVDDRKVAGILCEARPTEGFVVAGFGVNANVREEDLPRDVRAIAGSLRAHEGPHDVTRLMRDVLAHFSERYGALEAGRARDVLDAYAGLSVTLGRRVRPRHGPAGRAVAVLDTGALVVETPEGHRVEVLADDVPVEKEGA